MGRRFQCTAAVNPIAISFHGAAMSESESERESVCRNLERWLRRSPLGYEHVTEELLEEMAGALRSARACLGEPSSRDVDEAEMRDFLSLDEEVQRKMIREVIADICRKTWLSDLAHQDMRVVPRELFPEDPDRTPHDYIPRVRRVLDPGELCPGAAAFYRAVDDQIVAPSTTQWLVDPSTELSRRSWYGCLRTGSIPTLLPLLQHELVHRDQNWGTPPKGFSWAIPALFALVAAFHLPGPGFLRGAVVGLLFFGGLVARRARFSWGGVELLQEVQARVQEWLAGFPALLDLPDDLDLATSQNRDSAPLLQQLEIVAAHKTFRRSFWFAGVARSKRAAQLLRDARRIVGLRILGWSNRRIAWSLGAGVATWALTRYRLQADLDVEMRRRGWSQQRLELQIRWLLLWKALFPAYVSLRTLEARCRVTRGLPPVP